MFNPVRQEDERIYYLVAENDRGSLRSSLRLDVTDPISMQTVIGLAISCLLLFSIMFICLVCSYKKQKCCFKENQEDFQVCSETLVSKFNTSLYLLIYTEGNSDIE